MATIRRDLRLENFRIVSCQNEPTRVEVVVRIWSMDHPGKIAEKISSLPWLEGPDTREWDEGQLSHYPERQAKFFLARDPSLLSVNFDLLGPKGAFRVNILNAENGEIFYREFEEAA